MKNKFFVLIFTAVICLTFVINASAKTPRLVDEADLLTTDEEAEIRSRLDEVSEEHKVDIAILTKQSISEEDLKEISISHFEQAGYGFGSNYNGVLLLIALGEDDDDMYWYILTSGVAENAFLDDEIDSIMDEMRLPLKTDRFSEAFNIYIEECDKEINDELSFDFLICLVIAVVIGGIIALIVVSVFKGQLKSVKMQSGAMNYLKKDSMKVTNSSDLFLYRNITRVAKPQNNSRTGSSGSSSGRSYGGKGGRV